MKTTLTLLAALLTTPAMAAESANDVLPVCRAYLNGQDDVGYVVLEAKCSGIIEGLDFLADTTMIEEWRSCIPREVTHLQVLAVVVRWLDSRPARWHESFNKLALIAMHEAWPCRH
jgi:Rap1a immunity proteins